ncbi:cation diffusion facilitator family transporter [Ideonella sp. BN130291]|uniref:cation diffusion facilitator family transporter n=1 Tax=Ideonella sp. BN130291 TaxID=3112940 RepID=UPI002E26FE2C|nr:cation diffusion facilitator family transporter [Ideonella sp. BN130291]
MQVRGYLKLSVAAAVTTISLKTAAWAFTGSVGLLSDALESFVNLAAAVFALWIVGIADAPPDEEHPFGHRKAEYFSAGFEGLLILGAAVGIVWAAIERLLHPRALEALGWGASLTLLATAVNGLLAWRMLAAARTHRSIVLEADARHLFTDVWTSVGVVAGVLLVPLTGWLWLDPLLAIGVALNITREGASLVHRSVDGLMDRAMAPGDQAQVRELVERTLARQHAEAALTRLRTRIVGSRRHAELRCDVPSQWTMQRAARLRQDLLAELQGRFPDMEVLVELHPLADAPLQEAAR